MTIKIAGASDCISYSLENSRTLFTNSFQTDYAKTLHHITNACVHFRFGHHDILYAVHESNDILEPHTQSAKLLVC